jgi:pimeloyl-ACP methyl ester carboxylesterase
MKLRRILGYAALGIGATAVANRVLQRSAGVLEPALVGQQRTFRWRGMDVRYTEAGDPDDPDLVLLHGINASASSHEFREVFDDLSEDFHVIAPDLPGFGRSDRPPLRYSAPLYEDFVGDFVRQFDDPAVVASSLTGAYTAAASREGNVSRLLLLSPTTTAMPGERPMLTELVRAPVIGDTVVSLLGSTPSIRYFNADHGYYDADNITEELVDYQWRTIHQEGARYALASFFGGLLNSDLDLAAEIDALNVPVTLVWGRESEIIPLKQGRELADATGAKLVVFDDSDIQPHVEHAAEFLSAVRAELADEGEAVTDESESDDIEVEVEATGDTEETSEASDPTDDETTEGEDETTADDEAEAVGAEEEAE